MLKFTVTILGRFAVCIALHFLVGNGYRGSVSDIIGNIDHSEYNLTSKKLTS